MSRKEAGTEREITTPALFARSLGVALMAMAAVIVAQALNAWMGDLGALLWICACFFLPFITGIALGTRAAGNPGRVGGAVMGGTVALAPVLVAFAASLGVDASADRNQIILLAVFPLLGMAQGAISMPVGASARKRRLPA